MSLIAPHGGTLVDRILKSDAAARAKQEAAGLKSIALSPREAFDLEMIAIGAFSPLVGFMGEADFRSVCTSMRLIAEGGSPGVVWPIPVILSPANEVTGKINVGERVALNDPKGRLLGILTVTEKYQHDKDLEIPNVYKTTDDAHPGVKIVRGQGSF